MILDGQCGTFNPLLMQCLRDIAPTLQQELGKVTEEGLTEHRMEVISQEVMRRSELSTTSRPMRMLERERLKYNFFRTVSGELWFEYTRSPAMLTLSPYGARLLGVDEITVNPRQNERLAAHISDEEIEQLRERLRESSPQNPTVECECKLSFGDKEQPEHIIARTLWTEEEPPHYAGVIGKLIDEDQQSAEGAIPEWMNTHDLQTGLYNRHIAEERIKEHIQKARGGTFGMALIRIENYAVINESYGGEFGERLLRYVAEQLRLGARGGDILAQMGDDVFMVFFEYTRNAYAVGEWILGRLEGIYEDITLSVRVGMCYTAEGDAANFDSMLIAAERALDEAVQSERLVCVRLNEEGEKRQ